MPDTPRIFSRVEWDAQHGTGTLDPGPEDRVVIHHSFRPSLAPDATVEEEIAAIRGIERYHTSPPREWDGIGYNFLAAPSGRIYEGRGWRYRGAHAGPVNGESIGVCLLIDGSVDEPTIAMINAVRSLLGYGVELGEIAEIYTISGHRDHMPRTCPGDLVYDQLQTFRHDARPDIPVVVELEPLERPTLYIEPARARRLAPRHRPTAEVANGMTVGTFLYHLGERLGPVMSRLWAVLVDRAMDRLEEEARGAIERTL